MNSKTIVLAPRLSEKTYGLSQANNVYVFEVPAGVNKHDVARAVAAQFEVTVEKVNIANISGKSKRTISLTGKRMTNSNGTRSNISKAYVTLKKGQSLPIFAAIEEEEAKEQATQEKIDKAAAKQAVKETKSAQRGIHMPGKRSGNRGGDK